MMKPKVHEHQKSKLLEVGKKFVFAIVLFTVVFAQAQNKIIPPAEVSAAFEKEFPKMKPAWTQDYTGDDKSEIRYEAQFAFGNVNKAAAFDKLGNLKAVGTAVQLGQLPTNAFHYIRKKYALETINDASQVVDSNKKVTYEVGIKSAGKFYVLVFDKDGNLISSDEKD